MISWPPFVARPVAQSKNETAKNTPPATCGRVGRFAPVRNLPDRRLRFQSGERTIHVLSKSYNLSTPTVIRFQFLGFPVTIEPFFWIVIALLGGAIRANTPQAVLLLLVWMVVVLVSILVHELGHALAGRRYGATPEIRLHGFGGMAVMHGGRFNRWQSIVVSAAGPAFGFALGILVLLLHLTVFRHAELVLEARYAIIMLLYVNFFWTLINLLPILPLDGGQIFRDLAGPRRAGLVRWVSVFCAGAVALWALQAGMIFLGLIVAYLAFVNFQSGRTQPVQGGVLRD
jgi:stage IV sporulation protein FB